MCRLPWCAFVAILAVIAPSANGQESSSGLIRIISGADQSSGAGYYTIAPLVVNVNTAQGAPAVDAPVVFTVTGGEGLVSSSRSADAEATTCLLLHTDSNGLAAAYFMPEGAIGSDFEITVIANQNSCDFSTSPPIVQDSVVVSGQTLDPTDDDDNDGKINGDELKIGTNPLVFNLFSETHYAGFARVPHTEDDPLPWDFYSQSLAGAPTEWADLPIKATVVFDSVGTYHWVVDDFASINDLEFVRLSSELVHDVTSKWNPSGSNTLKATSDIIGAAFC